MNCLLYERGWSSRSFHRHLMMVVLYFSIYYPVFVIFIILQFFRALQIWLWKKYRHTSEAFSRDGFYTDHYSSQSIALATSFERFCNPSASNTAQTIGSIWRGSLHRVGSLSPSNVWFSSADVGESISSSLWTLHLCLWGLGISSFFSF